MVFSIHWFGFQEDTTLVVALYITKTVSLIRLEQNPGTSTNANVKFIQLSKRVERSSPNFSTGHWSILFEASACYFGRRHFPRGPAKLISSNVLHLGGNSCG